MICDFLKWTHLFGGTVFPLIMGFASDAIGQAGAVAVMAVGVAVRGVDVVGKAQNVDVIFAAYDENGKLVSAQKENVTLQQGKNKLDVSGIDFTNSESISVMIWDSMASMRPFADKATINK